MLIAIITACAVWVVSLMLGKKLDSGWGILLPCTMMPVITSMNLTFGEWRLIMVIALLATIVMLYHKRLRHYLLLPSCMALTGSIAAISLNFGAL